MKPRSKKRPPSRAIAIHAETLWKGEAQVRRLIRRAGDLAISVARAHGGATVLLTGDARAAELNRRFRGVDRATNVLAFPSNQAGYLGDVVIAYGVVAREAKQQGKSLAAHAAHLAVHGILHLLGHDHVLEAEARVMENMERRILASLGIADPYLRRKAA
jgi:probable rRNA maturation factor